MTFSQIKSDWLQDEQDSPWDSVFLPTSVSYAVSADDVNWQQIATVNEPATNVTEQSRTYKALNLNCTARYVKVSVSAASPGWTMIDEIEVRG